jgi:hypothetical protein
MGVLTKDELPGFLLPAWAAEGIPISAAHKVGLEELLHAIERMLAASPVSS